MGYLADDISECAVRLAVTLSPMSENEIRTLMDDLYRRHGYEYGIVTDPRPDSDHESWHHPNCHRALHLICTTAEPLRLIFLDEDGWRGVVVADGHLLSELVNELTFDYRFFVAPSDNRYAVEIDDHDIMTAVGTAAPILRAFKDRASL